jgi:hypothetical protein
MFSNVKGIISSSPATEAVRGVVPVGGRVIGGAVVPGEGVEIVDPGGPEGGGVAVAPDGGPEGVVAPGEGVGGCSESSAGTIATMLRSVTTLTAILILSISYFLSKV